MIKLQNRASTSGFTLIEMLIVIIVIAFLMGIVLTGTLGFQASARDTRRAGDLRNAQNFLELYFTKCGRYPGDEDCGVSSPTSWVGLSGIMEDADITTQFPKEIAGKQYFYGISSDGLNYTLGAEFERDHSLLKDDVDGTSNGIDCEDPVYCITSS